MGDIKAACCYIRGEEDRGGDCCDVFREVPLADVGWVFSVEGDKCELLREESGKDVLEVIDGCAGREIYNALLGCRIQLRKK